MPYIERINQIKKERDLSNQDLATMTGIPVSTVTKMLNGSTYDPPFSNYVKFAHALGFSLDDLAGLSRPIENKVEILTENTIEAYTRLIAEKDAHIAEKEERIQEHEKAVTVLRDQIVKERKICRRVATFAAVLIAIILLALVFDIVNGHLGYIRY